MIQLPIEIGDIILTGKFRNKRVVVKEIGADEHNLPTVNGRGILKIRIAKLMPIKESGMPRKKINQKEYQFYLFKDDVIVEGFEYKQDAMERKNDIGDSRMKVFSKTYLKSKLNIDPDDNSSWGTGSIKEITEAATKIYNKFTDKFGNEYGFDNYMDFAKFWFNLPIRRQKEYFPDNREQLQRAAANSKEARAKYTKIGEQSEVNIGQSIPAKIYNKFTDKFGNEYGFDNYMDFAKFWFNLPIRRQKEYFPDNREQLQRAAANSKEARAKYTKIGEQSEVNIGQSIPAKIKKDGDRFCIYRLSQPEGEETKALNRDFGSKQEAERTAKLRGFVLVNDKGEPQEYEADKQPKSLKTAKEKVEYVLEVVRKTMRLHELDLTGTDLEAEVEEYGRISDEIDRLTAEIKKLEVRFKELDAKFVLMLETLEKELGNSKETFIRAKNILITIKRKGTERTTFKYKEAFDWLYERVSPQMKKLINETMEAHKTVSMVKSSLGVQREGKINESWISDLYNKAKTFFVGIIAKLRNTNKTANSALDKLEQMV